MNRKKKIAIMYLLMLTMIFTDNISVLANNSTYTVTDGNEVSNACILLNRTLYQVISSEYFGRNCLL